MKTTALTLLACVMASPAFSAEATEGAKMAQKWCAGWRHIANDPQRTPKTLRNFLIRPHGEMPQIALTQRQIDNLLAYISTLRKWWLFDPWLDFAPRPDR